MEKIHKIFIVVNGHKEALLAIVFFTLLVLRNLNIFVINSLYNVTFIVY